MTLTKKPCRNGRRNMGCGHLDVDAICFKCWLGGMRSKHNEAAARAAFAEQFACVERLREQRRKRLEELKQEIPELVELGVCVP